MKTRPIVFSSSSVRSAPAELRNAIFLGSVAHSWITLKNLSTETFQLGGLVVHGTTDSPPKLGGVARSAGVVPEVNNFGVGTTPRVIASQSRCPPNLGGQR